MPRKAEKSEKPLKRVSERRTRKKKDAETVEMVAIEAVDETQTITLPNTPTKEIIMNPIILEEKKDPIPTISDIELCKQPEKARIRAPDDKLTMHGDPSCFIHLTNLVRPYMIPDLKAMLSTVGNFDPDHFWIDSIKSNCYAKFASVEDATNAIHKLNGMKWPEDNHKLLKADFANQNKMFMDTNKLFGTPSADIVDTQNEVKIPVNEENEIKSIESHKPASESKPLDQLFKATKTLPLLYWCPLSDAQVEEKEALRLNNV